MKYLQFLKRQPTLTLVRLIGIFAILFVIYLIWSPGMEITDGRHDLRKNGIWLQHGWLGDDSWFQRNNRNKSLFRNEQKVQKLTALLKSHGVKYIFPHLCPSSPQGQIAPVDKTQTELFLNEMSEIEVLPWVGGVFEVHCFPASPAWRRTFTTSIVQLLKEFPQLSGVQINIEPLPSGHKGFLLLLDELRLAIPGKIISVAAYPPPTRWHPFPNVHWQKSYFQEVAKRVDLIVPMMYDTAIKTTKFYRHLMSQWTIEVLNWSGDTPVLLGIPTYDDRNSGYHHPEIENIRTSLSGIHAGLNSYEVLPKNYFGISLYCEWEMDAEEWRFLKQGFGVKN